MIVRCWGARGSIGVSGVSYVKYGGDTTCMEIRTAGDDVVIVDAGTGIRRLGKRLLEEEKRKCTLLFTHAHWDHILGFPFFRPLYDSANSVRIVGCPLEQGNMQMLLARIMSPPCFPVSFDVIEADVQYEEYCSKSFFIGDMEIRTIPLSHPNKGVGYRFIEKGRSFVFLTDNELSYPHRGGRSFAEYADFCRGADLLVHDAEFSPEEYEEKRGWGHSHFMEVLELALAAGVKSLGLYHHNQDRADHDVDAIVERCRAELVKRGENLHCFAVAQDMVVDVGHG
ncbi:MBL fold metallo-hydrolase [Pseudodesulfovibrio senegalensis]|uniref:MBL fold metallo-hydrolase n=1 Tax=Pseudodesulfovibrio senegalensis TaxID=1721087 RepID=A0A6N6N6P8_9BACT|nr:MBL fold metallo-hydrolase [Pseudodesulfovibrio senegalensis]KAB1443408.1 MBL fold metallo-hydrolase [Pseudodesulfovibrio senegalensis]